MKYRIKIEALEWMDNNSYPRTTDIYEQVIESVDVEKVIKAVNGIA